MGAWVWARLRGWGRGGTRTGAAAGEVARRGAAVTFETAALRATGFAGAATGLAAFTGGFALDGAGAAAGLAGAFAAAFAPCADRTGV